VNDETNSAPPQADPHEQPANVTDKPSILDVFPEPPKITSDLYNIDSPDYVLNATEEKSGRVWDVSNGEIYLGSQYFEPEDGQTEASLAESDHLYKANITYVRELMSQEFVVRALIGDVAHFDEQAVAQLRSFVSPQPAKRASGE
jgi:hypothetical protein